MTVSITRMGGPESVGKFNLWSGQEAVIMNTALASSATVWKATIDGEVVGIIGVSPPTLMSDRAYIWFYHTKALEDHVFLLIRYSQRLIEVILNETPLLQGYCVIKDDPVAFEKSIRWLKWLGAEFYRPIGRKIPFQIRKKDG